MRTLTTNFRGQKIIVHQHFPTREGCVVSGGDCFELAGSEPGSGDWNLGRLLAEATGEPSMAPPDLRDDE